MRVFSYNNIIAIGKFKYLLLWIVHTKLLHQRYFEIKIKPKTL